MSKNHDIFIFWLRLANKIEFSGTPKPIKWEIDFRVSPEENSNGNESIWIKWKTNNFKV